MTIVWVTLKFVFVDGSLELDFPCEFHTDKMSSEGKISKHLRRNSEI